MLLALLTVAVIGYLLGALPFGYLVARAHGVNIFEVGSRNPGATNVRRVLGARAGNLVFALDALKGALASAWALLAGTDVSVSIGLDEWAQDFSGEIAGGAWVSLGVAGLAGSLIGHSFSCFTRFKGGKGVATAAGGFLVVAPPVVAAGGLAWAAVFYSTRYVSLASMVAGVVLPVASVLTGQPPVVLGLSGVVALFVLIRHRANISRLLNGTEPKAGAGPKPPAA